MTTAKAKAIAVRLRAHATDRNLDEAIRERAERLAELVEQKIQARRRAA